MIANILTKRQISFLEAVKKEPFITERFILTGGTALAAYHPGHRYSEDLDFFSEKEVDTLPLGAQFVKAEAALDLPRMIVAAPPEDWHAFFIEEAKKLKSEVF